jgi:hypothetical protein
MNEGAVTHLVELHRRAWRITAEEIPPLLILDCYVEESPSMKLQKHD